MVATYREHFGNADSRTHLHGQNARNAVETARKDVATLLGVESNEVIFTSGATESDNLAVLGLEEHGVSTNRRHIVTTSIEHKAVLEAAYHLRKNGFEVESVNPEISGRVDAESILSKVRRDTLLVSVQHVNNETGIIQPVKEIGDALWDTRTFFHIDAVQSCGKLVDEVRRLKYDMLSLSAHKMRGPQGVGALILRRKNNKRPPIRPIVFGGGHEGGLRAGTLPVALIVGFGKACEIAQAEYHSNLTGFKENKRRILDAIKKSKVSYEINGAPSYCIDSTLNISFPGVDSEALMIATKQYCSISNGSACTSSDYSPSHVLTAMGLPEERIESAVRLSWGANPLDMISFSALLSAVEAQH